MAHRERFLSLAGEMSSDGGWPTDIRTLDDLNAYLDAWPAIEPVKRDARLAMAEYVKEVV
jgi:hypothetical protein